MTGFLRYGTFAEWNGLGEEDPLLRHLWDEASNVVTATVVWPSGLNIVFKLAPVTVLDVRLTSCFWDEK